MSIIHPMFAMVLLTFAVGCMLFLSRMKALRSGAIRARYFKTMSDGEPTVAMTVAARHFTNLFELPVLFYAACLTSLLIGANSERFIFLAWAFVALRIAQAAIHLTYNNPRHRAIVYAGGFMIVLTMWGMLVMNSNLVA